MNDLNFTNRTLRTNGGLTYRLLLLALAMIFLLVGCNENSPTSTPTQEPTPTTIPTTELSEQEAIGLVQSFLREENCGLPSSPQTPKWEANEEEGVWRVKFIYYNSVLVTKVRKPSDVRFDVKYYERVREWVLLPSGQVISQQGLC